MENYTFFKAIDYSDCKLKVLDQIKLPFTKEYISIHNTEDAWHCIKNMQVRGAPAIALVGCLALAVEIKNSPTIVDIKAYVRNKMNYLVSARPTAVNIHKAREELSDKLSNWHENIEEKVIQWCEGLLALDINHNISIGQIGSQEIISLLSNDEEANVLTTCNTGSLATAGYGTALGVIRSLYSRGKLKCAYYTETRPYNQGMRLTSFEFNQDKIPGTLICDNMVGLLFKTTKICAVVVGADRVAANGDTANKIGTLQIAILAKYFNVPFFVAAPFTSIDLDTKSGKEIRIEERPSKELLQCPCSKKEFLASEDTNVWNPAFDITPSELITGGIITESKLFKFPFTFTSLNSSNV
ncbi:methylthioribose-1-phosphate isomerase [Lepeophtheirus salmonis]|uniref:Methylthioribose-1-phosphate isomerase n=1 Tax=Lepeophtheirus salmonis TaxID=72036 RepID=A0A0K2UD25_LEPSM|nr:methylthioribose-1-phosphate isomerase-like [Lepeophtheirus salmonis]